MPPRSARIRVEDMLAAMDRIMTYTSGLTYESFCADPRTVDAVIRNFEVMGEAARHVDESTAALSPSVPWPDVRDMRNILIHAYFGVDLETVWKTISDDLPELKRHLEALLELLAADS